LNKEAYKTLCH